MMNRRRPRATKVHNVLLAANEADAVAAMRRDPGLADWTIITAESQLYGLHIDQWAITERAASNMLWRYDHSASSRGTSTMRPSGVTHVTHAHTCENSPS